MTLCGAPSLKRDIPASRIGILCQRGFESSGRNMLMHISCQHTEKIPRLLMGLVFGLIWKQGIANTTNIGRVYAEISKREALSAMSGVRIILTK